MPSYYQKYGGFIFSAAINMYMDVLIKQTRSDDLIHVHYKNFEAVPSIDDIHHELARESLKMTGIKRGVAISFKADTPAGTGLGSSGACIVALLKGLSAYKGNEMSNIEAAEKSFEITQNLGLPDGKQDPYACAVGGFAVFDITQDGKVKITKPEIKKETTDKFLKNSLLFYTGVSRESSPILAAQDKEKVLELKHETKKIGLAVYDSFLKEDLDRFGSLMDNHWKIKKAMSQQMSNKRFDDIYDAAKKAGALGGKIIGAGGGGYFLFYCPTEQIKESVRATLRPFMLREVNFWIDEQGARVKKLDF